jgi:hypothetical protein
MWTLGGSRSFSLMALTTFPCPAFMSECVLLLLCTEQSSMIPLSKCTQRLMALGMEDQGLCGKTASLSLAFVCTPYRNATAPHMSHRCRQSELPKALHRTLYVDLVVMKPSARTRSHNNEEATNDLDAQLFPACFTVVVSSRVILASSIHFPESKTSKHSRSRYYPTGGSRGDSKHPSMYAFRTIIMAVGAYQAVGLAQLVSLF